jgi:hypothetical protein
MRKTFRTTAKEVQLQHLQHSFCRSSGWGFFATPLKNMTVSWGYDIPNIWKNNPLMFQTSNQLLKFQQFTEKMEDPRGSSGSHDSMGAISLSSLAM